MSEDVVVTITDSESIEMLATGGYAPQAYEARCWFGVFVTHVNGAYKNLLTASFPTGSMAQRWAEHVYGTSKLCTYYLAEVATPKAPPQAIPSVSYLDSPVGLDAVVAAVNNLLGGPPDSVTMQYANLFSGVFDLRPLLVALGGKHREMVLKHVALQSQVNKRGLNV